MTLQASSTHRLAYLVCSASRVLAKLKLSQSEWQDQHSDINREVQRIRASESELLHRLRIISSLRSSFPEDCSACELKYD